MPEPPPPSSTPSGAELAATVKGLARQRGFALVGIACAEPLPEALTRLHHWLAAGHHARMDWLTRDPARRADVRRTMPEAHSVLMLGMPYADATARQHPPAPSRLHGRVSRYARGADYHGVIEERLRLLARDLEELAARRDLEPPAWHAFVDAQPLMERQYAQKAGLGFIGRHTLLIHPARHGGGSWFFLAALALSWPLPADAPLEGTCGSCTRCLDACPTGAFPQPGVLDARRCISYLTIETKEPVDDPALATAMSDHLFGCDICQEVCPYNKLAPPLPPDSPFEGEGFLDLREVLAIRSNREFNVRFAGSPIQRARRRGLQRTAAQMLVNHARTTPPGEAAAWRELDELAEAVRALALSEAEEPRLRAVLEARLRDFDALRPATP